MRFVAICLLLTGCATTKEPDYSIEMYLKPDGDVRMVVKSKDKHTDFNLKAYELKPEKEHGPTDK